MHQQTRLAEQAGRDIVRLCHSGLDSSTLRDEAIKRLRRAIPLDAAFFATADPATLLFTSVTVDDVLDRATPQFLENEFAQDDVNKFGWLANGARHVGALSEATGYDLPRSPRYRDILAPMGLGDELRAAFVTGPSCWGFVCLHREQAGTPFSSDETALLTHLAPHLAEGLRKALLITSATTPETSDEPGLLVLAGDLSKLASTPAAEAWLEELATTDLPRQQTLPKAITAVATRLRGLASAGEAPAGMMPKVRVRTRSGEWLVVHASWLGGSSTAGQIAVILEHARPTELAPLLMQAYGLSKREGEVTQLVLQGWSTAEMSAGLHISSDTVQDHLKAIFDKVGVHSRRELARQFFFQQYRPHITAGHTPNGRGQF